MRRGRLFFAAGVALLLAVIAQPVLAATSSTGPVVIYAAPSGTGRACTSVRPCQLTTAQSEARSRIPTMHSEVDVYLEGGTYSLAAPMTLGSADSGRNGYRVVYQAAAGAQPVLSGGRAVTGWHLVPGTASTWEANLPPGFDSRQLYLNGQSLPLAQGLPPGVQFVQTSEGFLATSTAMASWPDPTGISAVFTGGNGAWTQTSCPIASISGLAITMAEPCWQNMHLKGEGVQELSWFDDPMGGFGGLSPTKSPTYFVNAYPLLTPGHWSIDQAAHTVYYVAEPGQNVPAARFVVPALQTLLKVSGTLARPAQDITLRGLQFEYGTWTAPDDTDGFPQMQADWYLSGPNANTTEGTCQFTSPGGSCPFASWTRTPANVVLSATHNIDILDDTFTHLGGAGLDLEYGSQGDLVQGNQFSDIAASGIQLGSTNDPEPADVGAGSDEIDRGNAIVDNYVHDVAIQYLGGIGIWLGYTQDSLVAHNQVDDVPYTAISIGWAGWHANVTDANSDPNINAGNIIRDNLLYSYMTTLGDGGAVYSNGSQATNWSTALHVTGNVAYNGANTDFSIYTDAASQYVDIVGNLVYDQPFDSFESGGCRTVGHIRITDNYFSQGGPAYPCFPYTDVQSTGTTTICEDPNPSQVPSAIVSAAGVEPAYRGLLDDEAPTVNMVGPTDLASSGGPVIISGSGFTPGSLVNFGSKVASTVKVLSGNYILATAPTGSGQEPVTVTTPAGTSPVTAATTIKLENNPPACIDYTGGGFSTALVTG